MLTLKGLSRAAFGRPVALWRTLAAVAAAGALAACQYAGPPEDPAGRSLTWFSYLGGEDIEKRCGPVAEDVFRFVYNGLADVQIRSYDVTMLPGGRGASVNAFAIPEPTVNRLKSVGEIVKAYNGVRAQAPMAVQGLAELRAALRDDRFETFKPVGLRLPSDEFYWTAVACVGGRFHANAWLYPTDRYKELKFPAVLQAHDRTGVAVYEARPENMRPDDPNRFRTSGPSGAYNMQLGPRGFVGIKGLF